MSTEEINDNLNILIDPTFTTVNRLFVLVYKVDANNNDNRFLNFIYPELWLKILIFLLIS